MTLEQQVHQNDVKLHKLIREVDSLKRQIAELTVAKNIVVQANVSSSNNRCNGCGCIIYNDKLFCHQCLIPKF